MTWLIQKSYSYLGPGFDIIEHGPGSARFINVTGASISRPLTLDHAPRVAQQREPHDEPIGDMPLVDGTVVVSERFRALVERFEPGRHLFAPIRLLRRHGEEIPGPWYFFTTRTDVDCILTDNDPRWFIRRARGDLMPRPRLDVPIPISKPQVEGLHLWTAGPLGWNALFVSDEFHQAYVEAELLNPFEAWREKCVDLDRPWIAAEHMGPCLPIWQNYVDKGRDTEIGII